MFGLNGFYYRPAVGGVSSQGVGTLYSILLDAVDPPFATTISYPSHFSIPVESGSITIAGLTGVKLQQKYAAGSYTSKLTQFRPAAYWPDNSVKWLHAYTDLNWSAGEKPTYRLIYGPGASAQAAPPASALTATVVGSGININTGTTQFCIRNNAPIINSGAYVLLNSDLTSFAPSGVGLSVIESGGQRIVVQVTGVMAAAGNAPLMIFKTYISATEGSDIVKFQHSAVFTADMKQNFIRGLGFRFDNNSSQILTRRFDKKPPYEVSALGGSTYVTLWPSGRSDTNGTGDYSIANAFRFAYLHKGSGVNAVLNVNMPTGYLALLDTGWSAFGGESDPDGTYSAINASLSGDFRGYSMDMEFAINLGASGVEKQQMFEAQPIGYREIISAIASSGYGYGASKYTAQYSAVDNAINSGISQFTWKRNDNCSDYGWHRYGQTYDKFWSPNENDPPNSSRPSYYRLNSADHYNVCELAYRQFHTTADTGCIHSARVLTDFALSCSVLKVKATDWGATTLWGRHRSCDSHAYFAHGFGSNPLPPASNADDQYTAIYGHYVHKSRLLFSWLIDANYAASSSYNTWIDDMTAGGHWPGATLIDVNREWETGFEESLIAYEYRPSIPGLLALLHNYASGIISQYPTGITPGDADIDTLFYYPDFLVRYADMFPDYPHVGVGGRTMEDTIVSTSINFSGTSFQPSKLKSIDAKTYELTGNRYFIDRHSNTLYHTIHASYDGYNTAFKGYWHSLGTSNVYNLRSWGRFKQTLQGLSTPLIPDSFQSKGRYFNFNNIQEDASDIESYAGKVYIYNNTGSPTTFPDCRIGIGPDENGYGEILLTSSGGLILSPFPEGGNWVDRHHYSVTPRIYAADGTVEYTRTTSLSGASIPTGLSAVYFTNVTSIRGPISEHAEVMVINNKAHNSAGELNGRMIGYIDNASGILHPIRSPVTGFFKGANTSPGRTAGVTWLSIGGSGRHLLSNESFRYVFNAPTELIIRNNNLDNLAVFCEFSGARVAGDVLKTKNVAVYGTQANIDYMLPFITGMSSLSGPGI